MRPLRKLWVSVPDLLRVDAEMTTTYGVRDTPTAQDVALERET